MNLELRRQLYHMCHAGYVLLPFMVGLGWAAVLCFAMAFAILAFSWARTQTSWKLPFIARLEEAADQVERQNPGLPYLGAFWYMVGYGLAMALFPLHIAVMSCLVLSFADALSTLIGLRWPGSKLTDRRSTGGTLAFFCTALFICAWFVSPARPWPARWAEPSGNLSRAGQLRNKGPLNIMDDNWIIPLLTGAGALLVGA